MNQKKIRIAGLLLLIIFVIGVMNYQFLRGPIVFDDNYLSLIANNKSEIVYSVLLSFLSGVLSIVVALTLFDYFKKDNYVLALGYIIFTLLNFIGIAMENFAVFSLLEVSQEYVSKADLSESSSFISLGATLYGFHKWAHYSFLLLSCLPVFVLFCNLFKLQLVPKSISVFGMIAATLMFINMILLMTEIKIPIDLMIPIGLLQLLFPFWLMIKGFNLKIEK
ncbi:MAG: DUF4386 domain-containing protein [Chitinophagales bacterium]